MTSNKKLGYLETGIAVVIVLFLYPIVIQWLWNLIIPHLTGFNQMTYWQAFGLRWLVGFLIFGPKHNKGD